MDLKLEKLNSIININNPRFGGAELIHQQGDYKNARKIQNKIIKKIKLWNNKNKVLFKFNIHYTYNLIIIECYDLKMGWSKELHYDFTETFKLGLLEYTITETHNKEYGYMKKYIFTYIPYYEEVAKRENIYLTYEEVVKKI